MKKWLKVTLAVFGGLAALAIIGAMLGGDEGTKESGAAPQQASTTDTTAPSGATCAGKPECATVAASL